ncbi:DNA repair protein UVH3 isoform X2 [Actinidia eriantha]|nr:DNA repair protein UVH3 isoform X2 [Actinidia eriantha]
MVLPAMNGKVDPAALAALPPSMQLDLLVQMRERLMAENRQKYQKVKKAPAKFSELQIQAYLKTVAFRREIDEVQKSAAGKGVGGVQTSRIASEANREFIFSTSFTGDKDVLTSAGVERQGEKLDQTPSESAPSVPLDSIASTRKSNAETGSIADDPERVFDGDIQTYLDERGHVRVSRVRALGIRMTRDLQRNLDLMKEIEQDIVHTNEIANRESLLDKNAGDVSRSLPDKVNVKETSCHGSGGSVHLDDRNDQSTSKNPNLMEISFEDDCGHKCLDVEDDLFARLVAGDPVMISSGDNSPSKKHSFESDSDCDWEEGVIEEKGDGSTHDVRKGSRLSFAEGGSNYDSEVEWEDGDSDVLKYAPTSLAEPRKISSKGALEEEALFQEAIRRSLEDLTGQQSSDAPFADDKSKKSRNMAGEIAGVGSVCQESDNTESNLPMENVVQIEKSSYGVVSGVESLDGEARMNKLNTDISPGQQFAPSMSVNTHNSMGGLREKPFARDPTYHVELIQQDTSEGNVLGEIGHKKSIARVEEKGVYLSVEKLASNVSSRVSTCATTCSGVNSQISDMVSEETPRVILADAQLNAFEAAENRRVLETIEHGDSSVKESTNHDVVQKMSEEQKGDEMAEQRGSLIEKFTSKDDHEQPTEVAASLEEELLNLSKERIDLADEQRKLERNAESVSGEMFAECQELLQMFGLPYIIAPMEAEAQCAYMELANLVDGVVTDDSDVFLFGAKSVYKNIFDERKYVETYFMKDIENELGQTREKLIRMALLLGSDYTEGVSGIGIVNAVEVVNAFPEEDGLRKFREWIESPDPTILGKFDVKTGSSSRKRGSKVSDNDVSCSNSTMEGLAASDQTVFQTMDDIQKTKLIFVDKHRNVSKNWHIPSAFPNEAVISAYASPQVDNSTEPFSWGKPDLFVLRKLCWEKFGWSTQKADELLLPVLKEYNKHETQLRLEAFYSFNERFAKIRSKRIKKAVKGITGKKSFELMDDSVQDASKSRKKRRVSPSDSREDNLVNSSSGVEDCVTKDESNSVQRSTAKQTRTTERAEPVPSEVRNPEPLVQREGRRNNNQNLSPRGRDRRSERGRAVGRGREKKKPCHANAKNSSDEGSNSNYEQEMQVEKLEGTRGVRKSTRIRKAVKYNLDDLEMDEPGKADQDEENSSDKEAVQEEPSADHGLLGEKTQHKAGDPSFEERSGGDYLEMGGGFCMGEAEPELETDQTSLGQDCDPSFEAELCKQYLNMDGGFCLDEGGTSKDPGTCSNPARRALSADADPAHSDFAVEADPDIGSVQLVSSPTIVVEGSIGDYHSGLGTSPPDSTRKDDSGTAPVNSLLAMPNLIRKRRKS